MKLILIVVLLGVVISTVSVEGLFFRKAAKHVRNFAGGARDMWRNYNNMKAANTKGADKYFHAKGNYEAARRGTGGRHAAALISNVREGLQIGKGILTRTPMKDIMSDYRADQRANKWGRSGGDPNKFRPKGLDKKYRK